MSTWQHHTAPADLMTSHPWCEFPLPPNPHVLQWRLWKTFKYSDHHRFKKPVCDPTWDKCEFASHFIHSYLLLALTGIFLGYLLMCLPAHAKITYLVFLVFTPTNKPTISVSSDEPGQHSLVWVNKTKDLTFPCGAPVSVVMVGDTYLIYHSMIYHWKRTQPLWSLRCSPFSVTTFALWNADGKSINRAHTYVFVLVQMIVYYMHYVLFLLVGPVFSCMSLRTPFSHNNHLKPVVVTFLKQELLMMASRLWEHTSSLHPNS